jgi:hypothetical protein
MEKGGVDMGNRDGGTKKWGIQEGADHIVPHPCKHSVMYVPLSLLLRNICNSVRLDVYSDTKQRHKQK